MKSLKPPLTSLPPETIWHILYLLPPRTVYKTISILSRHIRKVVQGRPIVVVLRMMNRKGREITKTTAVQKWTFLGTTQFRDKWSMCGDMVALDSYFDARHWTFSDIPQSGWSEYMLAEIRGSLCPPWNFRRSIAVYTETDNFLAVTGQTEQFAVNHLNEITSFSCFCRNTNVNQNLAPPLPTFPALRKLYILVGKQTLTPFNMKTMAPNLKSLHLSCWEAGQTTQLLPLLHTSPKTLTALNLKVYQTGEKQLDKITDFCLSYPPSIRTLKIDIPITLTQTIPILTKAYHILRKLQTIIFENWSDPTVLSTTLSAHNNHVVEIQLSVTFKPTQLHPTTEYCINIARAIKIAFPMLEAVDMDPLGPAGYDAASWEMGCMLANELRSVLGGNVRVWESQDSGET